MCLTSRAESHHDLFHIICRVSESESLSFQRSSWKNVQASWLATDPE